MSRRLPALVLQVSWDPDRDAEIMDFDEDGVPDLDDSKPLPAFACRRLETDRRKWVF